MVIVSAGSFLNIGMQKVEKPFSVDVFAALQAKSTSGTYPSILPFIVTKGTDCIAYSKRKKPRGSIPWKALSKIIRTDKKHQQKAEVF